MYPAQALSHTLAVQPVLDAIERDQTAPRAAFEHLSISQMLTGQVKGVANGVGLVDTDGQVAAIGLPYPAEAGDTLKQRFAGHMPQPVVLLDQPTALENGCQPHIAALTLHDTPRALSGAELQRKLALIHKILADDAKIRDLTEPWLAELQSLLHGSGRRKSAAQAYSRSYSV